MKIYLNAFLAITLAIVGVSANADGHGKDGVSGFVSTQLQFDNQRNSNTFRFNEAAVYFKKSMDNGFVFLDVPVTGGANTANINLGLTKAQGYVGYKYDNGVSWQLGQFDTIFGYELNDTIDGMFNQAGLVFANALPTVHVGWMLAYERNELGLKGFAGNGGGIGAMGGLNPELGAQITYNASTFHLALGGLYNKVTGVGTTGLFDLVLGTDIDAWTLAMNFDYRRDAGVTSNLTAIGAWISYEINNMWDFGIRPEYASRGTGTNTFQITGGPQIHLTDALDFKADYTFANVKVANVSTKQHSFILGAVHAF